MVIEFYFIGRSQKENLEHICDISQVSYLTLEDKLERQRVGSGIRRTPVGDTKLVEVNRLRT